MKSPIRVRRFLAYSVLACWIVATLFTVGDSIADEYARAISVREAVFHARPEADNVAQAEADVKASKGVLDFQTDRQLESRWEFRIWGALTLLGAALLAERRDVSGNTPLPNRAS
jgi:hypothetical protein